MPDEVSRWPKNWSLVLQTGQNAAKLRLPDLSLWPAEKDLVMSEIPRRTDSAKHSPTVLRQRSTMIHNAVIKPKETTHNDTDVLNKV